MQAAVEHRPVGPGRGDQVGIGGKRRRRLGRPRQVADSQRLGQVAIAAGQFDGGGFTLADVGAFITTDKGNAMEQAFAAMGLFDVGAKVQRRSPPGVLNLVLERLKGRKGA
ncbi:hypothetical protein D3C78_1012670 [compost metagenome]